MHDAPHIDRLAYGLRPSVRFRRTQEAAQLVLGYPLKAVRLNPFWAPLCRRLAAGGFVDFEELAGLASGVPAGRLEFFLDGLVADGYLHRRGVEGLAQYPTVSVIIPVHNRSGEIKECLESLQRLDYPHEKLEIIVVDDASGDESAAVASRFPVRLIRLAQNRGASYCRNRGALAAKGEILAFIDSDCLAGASWLMDLTPSFAGPSVGIVGGVVEGHFNRTALDRYEQAKSSLRVARRHTISKAEGDAFYVPSCNLLVKRSVFLRVKGFNQNLQVGEDVDLCWRVQDLGLRVMFQPSGEIFHKHRSKLKDFCRRRFQYGTSEPLLQKLHKKREKRFPLPLTALGFWLGWLALALGGTAWLAIAPVAVFALDGLRGLRAARLNGLPVGAAAVAGVVLRSYGAFVLHVAAFISRYYLALGVLLAPLAPALFALFAVCHLISATKEYLATKPNLRFPTFVWFFSLEQISYQLGVWWGCLRQTCFNPVSPRLTFRRTW